MIARRRGWEQVIGCRTVPNTATTATRRPRGLPGHSSRRGVPKRSFSKNLQDANHDFGCSLFHAPDCHFTVRES
jgi:hypothetical protein